MAKGYWIARIDVSDPDQYAKYIEADAEPFRKFGGRFPVRGGRFEAPEGSARARNIVIEFDSYETALACYRSSDYQAAKAFRDGACEADFVIIEGYDDANATVAGNGSGERPGCWRSRRQKGTGSHASMCTMRSGTRTMWPPMRKHSPNTAHGS